MKSIQYFYLIVILLLSLNSCSQINLKNQSDRQIKDTVMKEGMVLSIQNPNCLSITVRAGKGLNRYYSWNGGTRSVTLLAREDKWYGVYGAYFPGTDDHWEIHDGVTRLIAEEAVLNFDNFDQILCAISSKENNCRNNYYKYINGSFDFKNTMPSSLYPSDCSAHTSDGLFISVKKVNGPAHGGTLYVTIFQIKLNGLPVKNLPGSSDNRIMYSLPN